MPDDLPLIPVGVSARATFSDSWGDGDRDPDLVHVDQGEVRLTPQITQTITDAADTPIIAKSMLVATFGSDGWARWEYETEGDDRWIYVYDLSSTRLNPHIESGATHRVEFRGLRARGRAVEITGGPVRITPEMIDPELGFVNLARLLPAPSPTIVSIIGATADADRAERAAEAAEGSAGGAHADAAEASAGEAEASAVEARGYRDEADALAEAAEGHAGAAEVARTGAEAARDGAEGHASDALSARDAMRDAAASMDTGWIDLVFGSAYQVTTWGHPPQYRILHGVVHLRGIIQRASGNFAADHNPLNLWSQEPPLSDMPLPTGQRHFIVPGQSDGYVRLRLTVEGALIVHAPPSRNTPWLSFDGISWTVDETAAGAVPAELLEARDDATAAATAAEGYRDEAITAAEMASGLTGTGPPDFAAPPGTRYTDLDGTMGAWSWLKTSGTGRSGWTVVHGDTGWRILTSWDENGEMYGIALPSSASPTPGQSGEVRIRRVNFRTTMSFRSLSFTGTSTIFAVPSGFRLSEWSKTAAFVNNDFSVVDLIQSNIRLRHDGRSASSTFATLIDFTNDDSWPTSLPGSPG